MTDYNPDDPNRLGAPETPEKSYPDAPAESNPQAKDAPSEPAPTNGLLAGEKYGEHEESHEEESHEDHHDEEEEDHLLG